MRMPARAKGEGSAEAVACGGEVDGRHIAARKLDKRATEEIAEADTECREGKTCDILIGAEGDRQEAVEESHCERTENGTQQRNQDGKERNEICGVLFIEESADDTADAADIHDARNAEVQVARFFGDDFAGRAVQQGNALHDGTL